MEKGNRFIVDVTIINPVFLWKDVDFRIRLVELMLSVTRILCAHVDVNDIL